MSTAVPDTRAYFNISVPPPRMALTPAEREAAYARIKEEHGFDVRWGSPGVLDMEIMNAIAMPHHSLINAFESGCAEPWTTNLVTSLLIASNERNVLEIGGFTGQTSAWLAMALERLGGGTLTVCEIDGARVRQVKERIGGLGLKVATVNVVEADSLLYIPTIPNKSLGFVWQDGNHAKFHVEQEIVRLWDKMKPGGIITGHDVWGSCDLQTIYRKYGGAALDLPRLGPAGGLGIIQVGQRE